MKLWSYELPKQASNYMHPLHFHEANINHLPALSRASTQTAPFLSLLPCVAAMLIYRLPCHVRLLCPCLFSPLPYVDLPERDLLVQSLALSLPVFMLSLPVLHPAWKGYNRLHTAVLCVLLVKEGYFSQNRVFCKPLAFSALVCFAHRAETTISRTCRWAG